MDLKFKDNSQLKLAPFTQLEYIESIGTQYIDTGYKPNNNTRVVCEFNDLNHSAIWLFGAQTANANSAFAFLNGSGIYQGIRYGAVETDLAVTHNAIQHLDANKNVWTLENTTKTVTNSTFNCLYNMLIFGVQINGTVTPTSGAVRFYTFKVYDNDILVRDFIPCITDLNTPGMYDTVSAQFFYNQGTGDFIAGPVIIPSLPKTILLKTTTLYHKNTPNINGLQLLNDILDYQKNHQEEIKEYYYPTTQLWQDIITEHPDILYWYNMNHKLCVVICESDDPEQCAEDFLNAADSIQQELEDYPDLIPIIAENPSLAPIIAENPEVVHSLIDTGYETWLHNNGTAYITTQLSFPSGIRLCGKFYFISLVSNGYISIAGTYNGKHNILRVNQGPVLQVCINSNNSSTNKLEYSISLNTKYDLDLSNRVSAYIKNNGSTVASANFSGDIPQTPIAIFAITRYDSSNDMQVGTLKSSAIKLYDINDSVVLWLAPIQNNGNPCMIDLLTGTKYLNQGTGSFTYSLEPKNS